MLFALAALQAKAVSLSKEESKLLGKWYCKSGANDDVYVFDENGHYVKESELYGREVTDKGIWEIRGKKLYLARLIYISNGKEEKTNIVFIRDIVSVDPDHILLKHEGGLGNEVQTRCARKKRWFWW